MGTALGNACIRHGHWMCRACRLNNNDCRSRDPCARLLFLQTLPLRAIKGDLRRVPPEIALLRLAYSPAARPSGPSGSAACVSPQRRPGLLLPVGSGTKRAEPFLRFAPGRQNSPSLAKTTAPKRKAASARKSWQTLPLAHTRHHMSMVGHQGLEPRTR